MKKKIFIFQQREWHNRIGNFLAQSLIKDGYDLGCITFKKNIHARILEYHQDLYKIIISHDQIVENPEKYILEEYKNISLKQITEELNIESIWQLAQSARHHTKSYKKKFYYGFEQNKTDEEIELYFKALYFTAKRVYEEFKPDLIFTPNFVSLPHTIFNLYFKSKKVIMIGTVDCKVGGKDIFTYDYLNRDSNFIRLLKQLNQKSEISYDLSKVNKHIEESKNKMINDKYMLAQLDSFYFKGPIRHFLRFLKDSYISLRFKNVNRVEGLGPTPDDRTFAIILRDNLALLKNIFFEKKIKYHDLNRVGKFAYFPLQVQPESTIDCISPLYTNQIETARQIALQLPPDYTLVVKDHPWMYGARDIKYLNKIAKIPNIKLIDFRVNSLDVLSKAKILIVAGGSVAYEAAILKVPCLQLGELGTTLYLPNVFKRDISVRLKEQIENILLQGFGNDYDFKLRNYIYAGLTIGIDSTHRTSWEEKKAVNLDSTYEILKSEINSHFK
jgi:hypothetical protein